MELFFSNIINNNIIVLDAFESKHCIRVLRKKIGDMINVVDGKGNLYKSEIISVSNKDCHVKVKEILKDYAKRDYYIHIGISPLKNHDRIEWFIEKSVEIGVDEISFIGCDRTLQKSIKLDRFHRIAITAMKQTLKAKIPQINNIQNFKTFIQKCNDNNRFICHLEKGNKNDLFSFKNNIVKNKSSCILIGPEGDFTLDEIMISEKYKFYPITLGDSRLRTETAGVVACHLINIINNYI